MAVGDPLVAWQRRSCPAWCVVRHQDDDPLDDQRHMSAGRTVAARLYRERDLAPTAPPDQRLQVERGELAELVVVLHQAEWSPDAWIYVGDGTDQRLEVAAQDMRSVLDAAGQAVRDWRP